MAIAANVKMIIFLLILECLIADEINQAIILPIISTHLYRDHGNSSAN